MIYSSIAFWRRLTGDEDRARPWASGHACRSARVPDILVQVRQRIQVLIAAERQWMKWSRLRNQRFRRQMG